MKEFDLVAVMSGQHPTPPIAGVQMVVQAGMTAVLTEASRPMPRLPQSQRQVLIEAATRLAWQEACLSLGDVLPARPDSPLSKDAAQDFLTANAPLLSHLFERFQDLVQVQVTVKWDESLVLSRFRDAPELQSLFTGGAVPPALVAQSVQRLAHRLSAQMSLILAEASLDIAALPLTDAILWNGAVLVRATEVEALSRAVEAIDDLWSEGLHIRQIGPAPVGSFATLTLQRIAPAQIDAALAAFGLSSLQDIGLLAARRRARLMASADGDHRHEHDILRAAARLTPPRGFALAHVMAEGQRVEDRREVA